MNVVYRVQDIYGRGPFKPGFSQTWVDDSCRWMPPSWIAEFGLDCIRELPDGWHFGSAVRAATDLRIWFTPTELDRLRLLGYKPVSMEVERIVRASPYQVLFARAIPLRWKVQEVAL